MQRFGLSAFARRHATVLAGLVALALAGCGGGETASITSTPTISGTAASGAPLANAAITITCSDGTTKTGTADATGAYSIPVTGCPAPYVISATAQVGDVTQTLVSVLATTATGISTVNVTSLTNAIAATLASDGNPATLSANIATEKANITTSGVSDRNTALAAALAPALAAAGVTGSVDLIATQFTANRGGFDKVLDNIKVIVTPNGVSITSPGGAKTDDMGNMSGQTVTADLSAAAITINGSTNFKAGLTALPATVDDMSVADNVQAAFNSCFALAAAQRGTFGSTGQAAACAALPFASDYLNDGNTGSQEFDSYLTGSTYDGATFAKPEVIRFYSTTAGDQRALVRFALKRADGVGEWIQTVAENSTKTGGTWKVRGNQRLYRVSINGAVNREEQLETRGTGTTARAKGAYYYSGFTIGFDYGAGGAGGAVSGSSRGNGKKIAYVNVTGPGLPNNGIVLNPLLSGCDTFYAITTSSTATPASCTGFYKMQYRKATAADPENANSQSSFGSTSSPDFAATAATDATITGLQPFSAYQFKIFNVGNATTTPNLIYVERLRGRPVALGSTVGSGEVDKLTFNTGLATETKNLIDPLSSSAFAGGASFTVKWTNVAGAPAISKVQVQSRPIGGSTGTLYQDQTKVALTAASVALTNSGVAWGDMSKATASGNFNLVQLRGRDINDNEYLQNWRH